MSIQQLPNGKWRVQIRRKDCAKIDRVFETEEEARDVERTALAKITPKASGATLADIWSRYCDSRDFAEKKEWTRKTETSKAKTILRIIGNVEIAELEKRKSIIKDYIDTRSKEKSERTKKVPSGTTIRLEVALISTLCSYAIDRDYISSNPVIGIKRPTNKRRKRRVKENEVMLLKNYLEDDRAYDIHEDCRFLLCMYYLGCRPGELSNVKISNVDLSDRTILFEDTKTGLDRRAHIVIDAIDLVKDQIEYSQRKTKSAGELLFTTFNRKKVWSTFNYSHSIKKLKKEEILEETFHAHAMRREFISRHIENGTELFTIKKQTGHKSIAAVEIYDEALATSRNMRKTLDAEASKTRDIHLIEMLKSKKFTVDEIELILSKSK